MSGYEALEASWFGQAFLRVPSPLVFVSVTVDSAHYSNILEDDYLPWTEEKYPVVACFQQDRATLHTAKHNQYFMMKNEFILMNWAERSMDMKCIEIVSGDLVCPVRRLEQV